MSSYTIVPCIIPLLVSVTLVVFHNPRFDGLHNNHVIKYGYACSVVLQCSDTVRYQQLTVKPQIVKKYL